MSEVGIDQMKNLMRSFYESQIYCLDIICTLIERFSKLKVCQLLPVSPILMPLASERFPRSDRAVIATMTEHQIELVALISQSFQKSS